MGVGFFAVLQMAPLSSPSRRRRLGQAVSRSAYKAHNALVLEHLPLADAIASATARSLFPLVEGEDLIQVAREALVRSAPLCRARWALSAPLHRSGPAAPPARAGAPGAHLQQEE